jgi:hypothetical protein
VSDREPRSDAETREGATSAAEEFARRAEGGSTGILREFWLFLRHNKKWWLTPIIVVLLLVGLLIVLGGSAAAPFIYALF